MIAPELWDRLRELEPEAVAARARVSVDSNGVYEVPVLGSLVHVDPRAEEITPREPEIINLDFFLAVSVAQYLLSAREREPAGELVAPAQLPYGEVFFRGPHQLPGDALGACFAADGEKFRQVLERLGGRPAALADVGMEVHIFPRLPLWLGLWLADEEFPARVTFLFDRAAGDHMPLDALWSAVMMLVGAVRRLAAASKT